MDATTPKISLYALTGWSSAHTIQVIAFICHEEVLALNDSGSTHNFISKKVASELQLPVTPTEPFTVKVLNERSL